MNFYILLPSIKVLVGPHKTRKEAEDLWQGGLEMANLEAAQVPVLFLESESPIRISIPAPDPV